jgi:hypothetical protein
MKTIIIDHSGIVTKEKVYQVKVKLTQLSGNQYTKWVGIDATNEFDARMKAENKCVNIPEVAFIRAAECNLIGALK